MYCSLYSVQCSQPNLLLVKINNIIQFETVDTINLRSTHQRNYNHYLLHTMMEKRERERERKRVSELEREKEKGRN